jgi:acetyl-CoA synthetase
LSTLQVLGSVGEPINPEAWHWYYKVIGHEKCSIVDTFWQTETGGHVLTPLPGCTPMKPGSAVCIIKTLNQLSKDYVKLFCLWLHK